MSPASAPVPPRPVELRRLRIRTIPAPATLEVDGHVVNNPYDARLPDHSAHHIVVRLDGYTEETFDLELTRDREIVLRLFPDRDSRPEPRSPEPRRVEPRSVQPSRVEPRRSESRRERSEPRTTRPRERTSRGRQGAGFVTESPY